MLRNKFKYRAGNSIYFVKVSHELETWREGKKLPIASQFSATGQWLMEAWNSQIDYFAFCTYRWHWSESRARLCNTRGSGAYSDVVHVCINNNNRGERTNAKVCSLNKSQCLQRMENNTWSSFKKRFALLPRLSMLVMKSSRSTKAWCSLTYFRSSNLFLFLTSTR